MKKYNPIYLLAFLFGIFTLSIFFTSCKKDKLNTTSGLQFSNDTLTFDTLFTTLGSTTRFFTIRNKENKAIKISNIHLGGGTDSRYRINVDGDAGTSFTDIEIPAKDSLYVFVEVTIDPNDQTLPYLVLDSVQFQTNGINQHVILQTFGQNAHFFYADSITANTVWNNDLPYVILNYLQINLGAQLCINGGTKVYFGPGAAMVVEGDLKINGTDTNNTVLFRGVRLDEDIAGRPYDDFPGQYAGLFFLRNSTGNINYLEMRNAAYGINVGNIKTTDDPTVNLQTLLDMKWSNAPYVVIKNSKIYNQAYYGIFGFLGRIEAENLLVYNCGTNAVGLYCGGEYDFTNCTFYTRGSAYVSHTKEPLFYINDYFTYSTSSPSILADSTRAYFNNCILYGTLEEEIVTDRETNSTHAFDLLFTNCDLKTQQTLSLPFYNTCKTDDPQFKDVYKNDYHLKSGSPCIDFSNPPSTSTDIDGFSITGAKRDCGAYEYR